MRNRHQEAMHKLGPAGRLRAAERLFWSARGLKEAMLRSLHPDWTEAQIKQALKEYFLYART